MIIKIVPEVRYDGDGANFDALFMDAEQMQVERRLESDCPLAGFDVLADGPARIFSKDKAVPEPQKLETLLNLRVHGLEKVVRICGMCDVFVMNDSGKTVDRFSN